MKYFYSWATPVWMVFGAALVFCAFFWNTDSRASVRVSGTMKAEHACQAYISKNRRNNPNFQLLRVDATYPLLEANRPNDPDWYRVRVTGANPEERWVPTVCGQITLRIDGNDGTGDNGTTCTKKECNTADTEESFLLAVSWQPAFCKNHQNKPECKVRDDNAYQATHLTLHGLWPNKLRTCGTRYGFCGSLCKKPRKKGMCNYPEVPLSADVRQDLAEVMPSVTAGSCLERHEWWKHGPCSGWNADDYYTISARLVREFNDAGVSNFLASHIGKQVSESNFFQVVNHHFGDGTDKTLDLACSRGGDLTEIRITLPKDIGKKTPLSNLISQSTQSATGPSSNCRGKFRIVPISGSR